MSGIEFKECQTWGYKARTIENCSADATIAFAVDFSSPGERLTKSSCLNQGKIYIPYDPGEVWNKEVFNLVVEEIVSKLNKGNVKTLNIAGNGLYTMRDHGWEHQFQCDNLVYSVLGRIVEGLDSPLELIRSGGQTGFDEAGLKAAVRYGIPALCLAPKGWMYRDADGYDLLGDEKRFKQRF